MKPSFLRIALALLLAVPFGALAQAGAPAIVHAPEAAKLLPSAVFFRGQSATVQSRNAAGLHMADGMYVLATLVDNSGYSSGIQEKYQAYLLAEVPVEFSGKKLQPGAYGVGIVKDQFVVMDIGAHDLLTSPAAHDAELKRPMPLQILADTSAPNTFRLYFGRDYVVLSPAQ